MADRAAYEAATAQAASFEFINPGATHTITFNFETNGYISAYSEDLALQREVYYDWTLNSYLDQTAGTDLSVTVT